MARTARCFIPPGRGSRHAIRSMCCRPEEEKGRKREKKKRKKARKKKRGEENKRWAFRVCMIALGNGRRRPRVRYSTPPDKRKKGKRKEKKEKSADQLQFFSIPEGGITHAVHRRRALGGEEKKKTKKGREGRVKAAWGFSI